MFTIPRLIRGEMFQLEQFLPSMVHGGTESLIVYFNTIIPASKSTLLLCNEYINQVTSKDGCVLAESVPPCTLYHTRVKIVSLTIYGEQQGVQYLGGSSCMLPLVILR